MPAPSQQLIVGRPSDDVRTEMGRLLKTANHWYRADTYTESGGYVYTLPNRGTAGGALVNQGAGIALPASDAAFGFAPSLVFTGTQYLLSNLHASKFRFLHDGSGKECFVVFRTTAVQTLQGLLSTRAGGGYGVGSNLYLSSNTSNSTLSHSVGNGTDNPFGPNPTTAVGAIATNTPFLASVAYSEASSPEAFLCVNSATVANGASLAAPVAGVDPLEALNVGRFAGGGSNFIGAIADIIIFNRVLKPYERQLVREYVSLRYGITTPYPDSDEREVLKLNPFSWIRADYYATASGKVSAFLDKVLPGHSLTQGTAANQVATPTADAALGGFESASFSVANATRYTSSLANASWSFLHDGAGGTIFTALVPTSTTFGVVAGTRRGSTNAEIGSAIFRLNTNWAATIGNGSGAPVLESGGVGSTANGVGTYLSTEFFLPPAPDFVFRSKGTTIYTGDAALAPSTAAPQWSLTIGARADGTAPVDMRWADLLVFRRVLIPRERAAVRNYLASRYALT